MVQDLVVGAFWVCPFTFIAGGNYNNNSNAGSFYFNCNNGWTNSNYNYGFRSFLK